LTLRFAYTPKEEKLKDNNNFLKRRKIQYMENGEKIPE
jgi:hypothetical protein